MKIIAIYGQVGGGSIGIFMPIESLMSSFFLLSKNFRFVLEMAVETKDESKKEN
jgi:hypothetical protein